MLTRDEIKLTHDVIAPHIRRTPVLDIDPADVGVVAAAVQLKLEQLQLAGSFKTRGAFANLLLRQVPGAGVVAASGGNHGAAVAYAAMRLGVPAKIFVPSVASAAKVDRIRRYGADLVVCDGSFADALAASNEWCARSQALSVHSFDQKETLAGQGTVGCELEAQAPGLDTLLVPVGGGGLIGGIATWYAGRIRVVGVEPERSPTLAYALRAGRPVDAPIGGVAVDSLSPRRVGELCFALAQPAVDRVVLVNDEAIVAAQRTMWDIARLVCEPGGAAAFAALLSGAYVPAPDERVGIIVSGGNTTAVSFADVA